MTKKLYLLSTRGRTREWAFEVLVDPEHVPAWQEDGLQLEEIVNIVPAWWIDLGFPVRLYCFVQDILHLRNPLRH